MVFAPPELRTVRVTRYVTPLREGGSLPAIAEADDGFLYVLKFRGAGQGRKALVAELIGGELARVIARSNAALKMPELVLAELDVAFGRSEPDEEIQDLLKASVGLNLGLHYLSGAITYDPSVNIVPAALASQIVWLDALLLNVDRTARNPNLLMWHRQLWLIDHGAALYFHHAWQNWEEYVDKPFVQIKDHVLLPYVTELAAVDARMRVLLTEEVIRAIIGAIPDEWLNQEDEEASAEAMREVYVQFLIRRIARSESFVNAAQTALHGRI